MKLAFGGVGLVFLAFGAIDVISHIAYSLNGQRAEAQVVGRRVACAFEYQLSNESDVRRDVMSCEAAEAAAKAAAGRQARVARETIMRLSFTLADGKVREQEVRANASNRLSATMPIGSSVQIVYMETNPADFRTALNAARIAEVMLFMGTGLLVLLFVLLGTSDAGSRSDRAPAGAPRRRPAAAAETAARDPAGSPRGAVAGAGPTRARGRTA